MADVDKLRQKVTEKFTKVPWGKYESVTHEKLQQMAVSDDLAYYAGLDSAQGILSYTENISSSPTYTVTSTILTSNSFTVKKHRWTKISFRCLFGELTTDNTATNVYFTVEIDSANVQSFYPLFKYDIDDSPVEMTPVQNVWTGVLDSGAHTARARIIFTAGGPVRVVVPIILVVEDIGPTRYYG